jgi:spermidine synthase
MTEWFIETIHRTVTQRLAMDPVVYREQTEHQDLVIFDNPVYGRVLALDGAVQTTTADEFVYHEMLVHVPLIGHGNAREVLVIGGGDGGTLRRCLAHPVQRVTMVEIDRSVVDLCVKYLPGISAGAFDDPRTDLVIGDGCRYVKETDRRFDVVIVDSTDPIGPGAVLFTPEFFADCKRCLNPGGVLVNQGGVPWLQPDELRGFHGHMRGLFRDATAYAAAVPAYIGGVMTLGWASDDETLRLETVEGLTARYAAHGLNTRYYSPAVHKAAFALPPYIADLMR